MLLPFLRLLLAFAPWIAFLIFAQGSLFRLKFGLAIALTLSVALAWPLRGANDQNYAIVAARLFG